MKLSAPIFQLKRRAKLLARSQAIPLNQALDQIAQEQGFARWSLLAAQPGGEPERLTLLPRLANGDLLLLSGRPGHGKTSLGLTLLLEAARNKRRAVLFTLEMTEAQARNSLCRLEETATDLRSEIEIVTSEDICAKFIIDHLGEEAANCVAVIDYLQLLDQQRSKPPLSNQMLALGAFAQRTGATLAFISQIDRSFDAEVKTMPDLKDIRLPNYLDLTLFTKACFLHGGKMRLQNVA
ncbi:DNA helicase [Aureimonas fodinaquatilis]|uniref:DNA helicase n=1 Tax=Aureimonas fodinaquatilis TaxID=2565783 RepID=A0A5B0DWJ0_9HYPH|nr:DNA helicase [Aureimonas fodinaquatilis]KAA0970352.1 DNA helicase [Aureimonas fodinaquatilis]